MDSIRPIGLLSHRIVLSLSVCFHVLGPAASAGLLDAEYFVGGRQFDRHVCKRGFSFFSDAVATRRKKSHGRCS